MRRLSNYLVDFLLLLALLGYGPLSVKSGSSCGHDNLDRIRPHSVSITEFGAVGDGVTLNTKAFQNAIFYLQSFADKGGAKLFVPAGRWLTGSFDLISHLTLWLDKDAAILGSTEAIDKGSVMGAAILIIVSQSDNLEAVQRADSITLLNNSDDWPVVDPLPSYGRGRELPGGRHKSLIYGRNLTDVIITGDNGTIDGQGDIWWSCFKKKTLNYTRPHLVELMNSTEIVISNLTFLNSPFWTIHPVYCSRVTVRNMTILAPLNSPNTDGIDPDSSDNVCIEDCYISTGDDLIAIKSGWDEYGISYGRPSTNITIRGLVGESNTSAGIAIGSEMSGGVSNVLAENLYFCNSHTAIRIKTSPGRGGYVTNIFVSNMTLSNVSTAITFTGQYGEHPDDQFDPNALPEIRSITIENVRGENIGKAGILDGIEGDEFVNICLYNITFNAISSIPWNCSNIQGYSDLVAPATCGPLAERIFPQHSSDCYNPTNYLRSSSNLKRDSQLLSW